ncbi:MAG: hypothetical protein JXR51_06170 [Bacteroidales bacterium]|nr:hypothetical protein [Bacteroidales bacterium]MBN2756747.1 hypothetical protein [Bacteroidales bacterium]
MRVLFLILLVSASSLIACDKEIENTQEQEQAILDEMLIKIQILADTEQCINDNDWNFTAIGSKACGGPTGFIAYSIKIDTILFLQKVDEYTNAQEEFNKKWNIVSDCSIIVAPESIICIDGKPEFAY